VSFFIICSFAHAASFDCAEASTTIENLICSNSKLSDLDSQLAQVYQRTLADPFSADSIKNDQKNWLTAARNKCADSDCLMRAYAERISVLNSLTQANPTTQSKPEGSATSNVVSSQPVSTTGPEPESRSKHQAPPTSAQSNVSEKNKAESKSSQEKESNIPALLFIALVGALAYIRYKRKEPWRGNWFSLKKIDGRDLHGKQVHSGLMMCDSEKELLFQSKSTLNEMQCPECGNHKLSGNVTIHYGPVQLFREIKTAKGYANELVAKKWLYYGPQLESGQHAKCPDCKWEMKNSRFENFGTKAALVIAASVAAHKLFSKPTK